MYFFAFLTDRIISSILTLCASKLVKEFISNRKPIGEVRRTLQMG